jgi:hypothetical protein
MQVERGPTRGHRYYPAMDAVQVPGGPLLSCEDGTRDRRAYNLQMEWDLRSRRSEVSDP